MDAITIRNLAVIRLFAAFDEIRYIQIRASEPAQLLLKYQPRGLDSMATDYVGFRLAADMRAQIEQICLTHGITLSEWIRSACVAALGNTAMGLGGVEEGYAQARGLATQLAHSLINHARDLLPSTYEEFLARYGIAGPGRDPNAG